MSKDRIVGIYFLAFSLVLLVSSQSDPFYNWDIVGYIAIVKSYETDDLREIHTFAYGELARAVPAEIFETFVPRDGGYESEQSQDPGGFSEQLHFYRFRPVYLALLFVLYRLGLNVVFASHLISGVSATLGLCLLFVMARKRIENRLLYILPILAVVFGLLDIARLSTPDGIAFLGVVVCGGLFLKDRAALLAVLPLLVMLRTDLILFTLPMLGYLLFWSTHRKLAILVSGSGLCVLFYLMYHSFENPGWAATFYCAFIEKPLYPMSAKLEVNFLQYLTATIKGVKSVANNRAFLVYICVLGSSLHLILTEVKSRGNSSVLQEKATAIIAISLFYIVMHFALYPTFTERFFVGQYVLTTFAFFELLSRNRHQGSELRNVGAGCRLS